MASKIKFTSKTRRGLRLVHQLLVNSFVDSLPPSSTQLARFSKEQREDYEQGLEWLEQQLGDRSGPEPSDSD